MCGVVGIVGQSNVNQVLFDALTVLQHRGQDAAGIVTCDSGSLFMRKDNGLVRDVFRTRHMKYLRGRIGIGHVRYPTAGTHSSAESQPFYVNSPFGICLAHNGNLTNTKEILCKLHDEDRRHINTESDSEILLNVLARELSNVSSVQLSPSDIFMAVNNLHRQCKGAYAVIALINGTGIVGFRDPNGIRPICVGRRDTRNGPEIMMASESAALVSCGFQIVSDIDPGEAVFIDNKGIVHRGKCDFEVKRRSCLFEFIYLARQDSIIDGVSVYAARINMGKRLAKQISNRKELPAIDAVIPVPDTSRTVALEVAQNLGVIYREGFVKNPYIGRTFIMPGQFERVRSVRRKLNPVPTEFRGRHVLIVDDSIVRGTTSRQIVEMARESGASRVTFASASPEVIAPNVYGIDMPNASDLIAHGRSNEDINMLISSDSLVYQKLADLKESIISLNPKLDHFEDSIFTGNYPTEGIDENYLFNLAKERTNRKDQSDSLDQYSLDLPVDSAS